MNMTIPFSSSSTTIPFWILLTMGSIMSFGITWFIIPSIVSISKVKNLCNSPNLRTSHNGNIPTLGGIAVFIGLILSTVIFTGSQFIYELKYIICGLIIVFFVGIKDDILVIDPMKKLAGQVFAAILVSCFANIRIPGLFGLLGIGTLPYSASILLTVFVFIVVTNGFNLIDGIDGLASGIGALTSTIFGVWFWLSGDTAFSVFSFSLVGALSAFFWFNVFSKRNKIFLGDTGSLVTGFVVSVLVCRFLQTDPGFMKHTAMTSAPAVAFGILIIPLFDSLRVFFLRISQGNSPFKADRQHIHHCFLKLGFTHLHSTLILLVTNIFFIILSFAFKNLGVIWLTFLIFGIATIMSFILSVFVNRADKNIIHSVFYGYIDLKIPRNSNKIPKKNAIPTFTQSDYN